MFTNVNSTSYEESLFNVWYAETQRLCRRAGELMPEEIEDIMSERGVSYERAVTASLEALETHLRKNPARSFDREALRPNQIRTQSGSPANLHVSSSTVNLRRSPDSSGEKNSGCKLHFRNRDKKLTEEDLTSHFSKNYGPVSGVRIFRARDGNRELQGCGDLEFQQAAHADEALAKKDHYINGSHVWLQAKSQLHVAAFQLFLKNIPFNISDEAFRAALEQYAEVADVRLTSDRGHALVRLKRDSDVQKLLDQRIIRVMSNDVTCAANNRNSAGKAPTKPDQELISLHQ